MTDYISAKEVAKHIRKDLKTKFPSIKFSVRSETGTIRISYTDGVPAEEIKEICTKYDSRRDYDPQYCDYRKSEPVEINGEMLTTSVDYFFIDRNLSFKYCQEVYSYVINNYAISSKAEVKETSTGSGYFDCLDFNELRYFQEVAQRCNTFSPVEEQEEERKRLEKEEYEKWLQSEEGKRITSVVQGNYTSCDISEEPDEIELTPEKTILNLPIMVEAKFPRLNKQDHIEEYQEQLDGGDFERERIKLLEVYDLTAEEYKTFTENFLAIYTFLEEVPGHSEKDDKGWYRLGIAVTCKETGNVIAIDTQGFKYARYVGFFDHEARILECINRQKLVTLEEAQEAAALAAANIEIDFINPIKIKVDEFWVTAKFAHSRKNSTVEQYIEEVEKGNFKDTDVLVQCVFDMSLEEYNHFQNHLLEKQDFLKNVPGCFCRRPDNTWYRKATMVTCLSEKKAMIVDTQGHNYAWYVGILNITESEEIPQIGKQTPGQNDAPLKLLPAQTIYTGIRVSVYRSGAEDCTNGGVSSKYEELLIIGEGIDPVCEETDPEKVVELKNRLGHYFVKPITIEKHSMMGGNFVYCCDSRFREICGYPIPIHDRVEYTSYDKKIDTKRERYQDLAQKASEQADAAYQGAKQIADIIPLGQPILVDHHSERRHRKDISRIENGFRKSWELGKKAEYYQKRSDGVGKSGISSDDPHAVDKLEDNLQARIDLQEKMKATNKLVRKNDHKGLAQMGFSEPEIQESKIYFHQMS
ncbi:DUF3560 domain-containing protein [Mastigocoleus testarum]|uniref:Large polyvalent protein associated domain-containing protein n=1 Tax=Mastigocoleus testarum BC008 TaxID=371196 RepID=A0A0V7ZCI7_9CYAN|nr:DUF3560 domain-containing protein [Mastigocoleus testarum]KST62238.1 hypothetical protein BC008_08695 [Mastigocoleus testarum BC008]